MKDWLKDYFSFNRSEQRGLILLLGLLLLSILFSYFSPALVKEKQFNSADFRAQVEAFLKDTVPKTEETHHKSGDYIKQDYNKKVSGLEEFISNPFYFNPNELGEEGWKKTGLDERVIRNILKYKEKGGFFRDKEDFRKIYGLNKSAYSMLEPYLTFEEVSKFSSPAPADSNSAWKKPVYPEISNDEEAIILELNSVDSAGLLVLPGIGPSFASRIIKYRELLGGYASVNQLMEVKGMDSARYNGILDRIIADPGQIRKMDLNKVIFKEMLRHPYFEYYLVKAIFNYRDRIKAFDSVAQVKQIDNIYPELYDKISPYLEVSDIKDR